MTTIRHDPPARTSPSLVAALLGLALGACARPPADASPAPAVPPATASTPPAVPPPAPPAESRRRVVVNGTRVTDARLAEIENHYGMRIADGDYWYDRVSGAAGPAGGPTLTFVVPGLDLGGPLQPAGHAAEWLRQTGVWGVALLLLGMSALILMGVSRLMFCPLAGALMGFWGGLGLSIAGTMISYYAAFRVIRGRRANDEAAPPLHPKLAFLAGRPGLAAVIVSRIVPVPGMIVTLALSMSNVRTRTYLLGSLIGLIPEAAPLVLLGAGILNPDSEKFTSLVVGAFVCILVAWLATHYLVRRFKHGS